MKIGYPCINLDIGCRADRTFRLKSYSRERFFETVDNNLQCLRRILEFNAEHVLLFFRITSDLIPFASHPVCDVPWQDLYKETFNEIGNYIRTRDIRISMHPDQFIVLNSLDDGVVDRSLRELHYHTAVLDLLGLNSTAKIQLHVGGAYGNKEKSIKRFITRYQSLDEAILKRLVIENDDRLYTLADCLSIHEETLIPVLFDVLHHSLNPSGEDVHEALARASETWQRRDGLMMVDYSTPLPGGRRGRHAETLDSLDFLRFLEKSAPYDFDCMLEIKDKERSALVALKSVRTDPRFYSPEVR
jgi:UV DNA damage endonuclease